MAHVDDFARRGAEVGLSPSLSSHMGEYAFIYHALAGHPEDGADRLHQAMQGYSVMGDHPCVAHALETTAFYASCSGRADVAVALHGAALQLWDDAGVVVPPWERMLTEPVNEFCRGLWSEEELATRLAEGAVLGTRQAVALAIEITGLADR